jgi:hypothetical protein
MQMGNLVCIHYSSQSRLFWELCIYAVPLEDFEEDKGLC